MHHLLAGIITCIFSEHNIFQSPGQSFIVHLIFMIFLFFVIT